MNGECQTCVARFERHRTECLALPLGDDRPPLPRYDCERPDCPLYEAMLSRLDDRMPELSAHLRALRDLMARHPRRAEEWQQRQEELDLIEHRSSFAPSVTSSWDHSIPRELDLPEDHFDRNRLAWVRLEQGLAGARAAGIHILFLLGPTQAGKSCAAARWVSRVAGGRFVTSARVAGLREAVGSKDREELQVLRSAPALVIDDMGRSDTIADRDRVAELARTRESNGRMTVITAMPEVGRIIPASIAKRSRTAICYDLRSV